MNSDDDFVILTRDYEGLPAAMLDVAKRHMRIEFTRDDDYLKLCLKRAIEYFELYSGQLVFKSDVGWSPTQLTGTNTSAECPVLPVDSFNAKDGEGTDVSADYIIVPGESATVYPLFASKAGTPLPVGLGVVLVAGFTDYDKMPPVVVDKVLRICATLYENRETVTTPIQTMPFWLNDLLIGSWVPRC